MSKEMMDKVEQSVGLGIAGIATDFFPQKSPEAELACFGAKLALDIGINIITTAASVGIAAGLGQMVPRIVDGKEVVDKVTGEVQMVLKFKDTYGFVDAASNAAVRIIYG
jgi:hypothetical protein